MKPGRPAVERENVINEEVQKQYVVLSPCIIEGMDREPARRALRKNRSWRVEAGVGTAVVVSLDDEASPSRLHACSCCHSGMPAFRPKTRPNGAFTALYLCPRSRRPCCLGH